MKNANIYIAEYLFEKAKRYAQEDLRRSEVITISVIMQVGLPGIIRNDTECGKVCMVIMWYSN